MFCMKERKHTSSDRSLASAEGLSAGAANLVDFLMTNGHYR